MNGIDLRKTNGFRETDQGGCQVCIYREEQVCWKLIRETDLKHICFHFKHERIKRTKEISQ